MKAFRCPGFCLHLIGFLLLLLLGHTGSTVCGQGLPELGNRIGSSIPKGKTALAAPKREIPPKALKALDPAQLQFNQLPRTVNDLKAIEQVTLKLVPDLQKATVNIRVGGGEGSGVVISPEGHVLTAAHVVGELGKSVIIIFNDGRRHRATVVGIDARSDAAIVRLNGRGPYDFVPMAEDYFVNTGDWVIAIGHPNGYEVSRLPVVRVGRVVDTAKRTLQTDCSLVGGDSGGPLFDMHGRVVGIHSRIGVSNTINYHVPVQIYLNQWEELNEGDTRLADADKDPPKPKQKAYLGIRGRDATSTGCLITEVSPNGPAAEAGLQRGDLIVSCEDEKIKAFADLVTILKEHEPDETIEFIIERNGARKTIPVKLAGTEL
ncbi:MAG: trypsin-like peptidase domain-containing protein [Planctomycetaceae bacterium]|nr:trypsin-like peptidase domain-containing protein [Planctomycetaceae bacterium]